MGRKTKDILKRAFFQVYKLALRLGFHFFPAHYYSSEPNILELEKTKDTWAKPTPFHGIPVNLDQELQSLRTVCLPYQTEYIGNPIYQEGVRRNLGPGYGFIEAQVLHAVIRHYQPARLIEVGSGVSTYCSLAALRKNQAEGKRSGSITCLEPYPSKGLQTLARSNPDLRLMARPVQSGPEDLFRELSAGDILFIDSSHVLKAASDVHHIVLEVLPQLAPGVLVHFHDIYFPYDYQRDLLLTFLHNNETPFLRAFLAFNSKFRILFSLSHLHYEKKEALKAIFPDYDPQSDRQGLRDRSEDPQKHFPSSLWLAVQG